MGKPCSCMQFIKSCISYYTSCENLYQVPQVMCAASECAMKPKVRIIIIITIVLSYSGKRYHSFFCHWHCYPYVVSTSSQSVHLRIFEIGGKDLVMPFSAHSLNCWSYECVGHSWMFGMQRLKNIMRN